MTTKWQYNSLKTTQQVEIRQNTLLFTSKTNEKHYTTTLQKRVWINKNV